MSVKQLFLRSIFRLGFACGWAALAGLWLGPAGAAAASPESDIRRDAAVNAIERVMPSVVNIATETVIEYHDFYDELLRQFYGWRGRPARQEKSISLGSGVIVDEEGYVLTNLHVVRRANRIQVKLWDGREYEADALVATPGSDVALLKIRCKAGEKFKAMRLAPDDDLLLGETVLALGNPFGLGGSVTKGILSSKNRRPSTGNEPLNVEDWLQTDAAINPGNSGGPLVNLRGELIGLNVAVYRDPDQRGERGMGVGFSIPVKQVAAALSHFFTPEVTDSLWFGAQFRGSAPLVVSAVPAGSPAARAGLREGDELLRVNGETPPSLVGCNRLLVAASNRTAKLVISRGGERQTLTVKMIPFEDLIRQKVGLTVLEMSRETAERLGFRPGEGLYIEAVEAGSPADRAQLQRGFVLTAVEGQSVGELRVLASILTDKKKGDAVRLTVIVPRRLGGSYMEFRQGTVEVVLR